VEEVNNRNRWWINHDFKKDYVKWIKKSTLT